MKNLAEKRRITRADAVAGHCRECLDHWRMRGMQFETAGPMLASDFVTISRMRRDIG